MMRKISFLFAWFLLVSPYQVEATCEPNIPGDITGDCKVDFNDFAMIASDWLKAGKPHEWVAIYNGPGNAIDKAYAIAVDSNDNIYVTGWSEGSGTSSDYATIKYSPDSNQPVWIARYDGPAGGVDWPCAIVVDGNNNIYVTGFSYASGPGFDYATIKYSPDSNQPVWVARYHAKASGYGSHNDIDVDSNDNIYVTGESTGNGASTDTATIKYAPDSNIPVWVARYSSSTGYAIAVDGNDNIYVAGVSTGPDYSTIKYSPDSNIPVWVARYNGPAGGYDVALAIAVDSNDNIYVTGLSEGSATDYDYTTIKYSPDSNQPVWIARYDGLAGGVDWACAIVVDGNNNIYVTGYSYGSGPGFDYATIKYSPDSNQPVWVARYHAKASGYGSHNDIAVDSNDNIYVTGDSLVSGTNDDYATLKYSPDYTCTPPVIGDLDHDCKVDIYDLRIFCQHWLESNL